MILSILINSITKNIMMLMVQKFDTITTNIDESGCIEKRYI